MSVYKTRQDGFASEVNAYGLYGRGALVGVALMLDLGGLGVALAKRHCARENATLGKPRASEVIVVA